MKIVIPTRGRGKLDTLGLKVIEDVQADVVILAHNKTSRDKVMEWHPEWGANIHILPKERRGMYADAINYSIDTFAEDGGYILILDDDMRKFVKPTIDQKKLRTAFKTGVEFKEFLEYAFKCCEKNKTKLWGTYPVANAMFMKKRISSKRFSSAFMGIIKSDLRFNTDLKSKADYAFIAEHILRYKKVLRFDYIGYVCDYSSKNGGCSIYRTPAVQEESCEYLIKKYPWLFSHDIKRKGEVRCSL